MTDGNRTLRKVKLGKAGVYLTLKSEKSDTRLRSKGHKRVLGCFSLVCFGFVCLILFLEKEWERTLQAERT